MDHRTSTAESLKTAGNQAFGAKKFKKAAKIYRDAIKLDPENAVLYSNRAQCFLYLHDYDRALRDGIDGLRFVKEVKIKSKLLFRCGLASKHSGSIQEAQDYFKQVIALEPQNVPALTELKELESNFEALLKHCAASYSHKIDVKIVHEVPVAFKSLFETTSNPMEPSSSLESQEKSHVEPQALPSYGKNEHVISTEHRASTIPYGLRPTMTVLLALKSVPANQKQDAYKMILDLTKEDIAELFGNSAAGVEPEFLDLFLEAACFRSLPHTLESNISKLCSTLKFLLKMPRFHLSLALCDLSNTIRLLNQIQLYLPSEFDRMKKILF